MTTIREEAEKHVDAIRILSESGEISEQQVTFIWNQAFIAGTKCEAVQALVKVLEKIASAPPIRQWDGVTVAYSQSQMEAKHALEAWAKANE